MKIIISLSFFFLLNCFYSQNLVNDPSFEDYKRCPFHITTVPRDFKLIQWYPATYGSSDYFNSCVKSPNATAGVPVNQLGHQKPRTGNGYVGLVSTKFMNEREYVGSKLKEPLKSNIKYYVEFWISLADRSYFGISKYGAHFSEKKIETKRLFISPLPVEPQIVSNEATIDTSNWIKISGSFIAEGGEEYITIGSFSQKNKDFIDTKRKNNKNSREAYYYVDDVLVEKFEKDVIITEKDKPILNEPVILKNITFEFGKSILKEVSFTELDQLVILLNDNPTYKIALSGYTDNVGQQEDNLKLSEARAKTVAEYLISKGITIERITYKGYGNSNTIASNDNQIGRAKNRRVEFILTE